MNASVKLAAKLELGTNLLIHFHTDKTIPVGSLLERIIQGLKGSDIAVPGDQYLAIQFDHHQYYIDGQPALELLALLSIQIDMCKRLRIHGSIFPFSSEKFGLLKLLSTQAVDEQILRQFCREQELPWLAMSDPWMLDPVYIPKPWGQEIWYTGIEARGQAGVVADNASIPLPWLLDLMSNQVGLAQGISPVLLKVLDPHADELFGDLYFELHQQKQEVYVVTHLDPSAWPDGVGSIQLGFAAKIRKQFESDEAFKLAYLQSVRAYETVRRQIDCHLDELKLSEGLDPNEPVSSLQLTNWINKLLLSTDNKDLFDRELTLRDAMNEFVASYPLKLGDVVTVPNLVPHALQHGVRVVEFQTPVYERKILSFNQKVLTQTCWDTEEALTLVDMDSTRIPVPEILQESAQCRIERIVDFEDFEVQRIWIEGSYLLQRGTYTVLMVLDGELTFGCSKKNQLICAGQAVLIPKSKEGFLISTSNPLLFLLAAPKSSLK